MRNRTLAGLLAVAITAIVAPPASATPIMGGPTGLTGPHSTITFDELGNLQGVAVTNQFAGLGVTFSGALIWDNATQGQAGSTGFAGGDLTSDGGQVVTMTFNQLMTGVAFAAVDQAGTYTIAAFRGGVGGTLVETFNLLIPLNPGSGFIGFQGTTGFDTIRLTPQTALRIAIDTMQLQPVPEPVSLMLLGSGLAALVARRRRS